MTALAEVAGRARCGASASSTCRWGATYRAGRHPARALTELSPIAPVARAVRRSAHRHLQPGVEERLPRHARDVERLVPQRGQGEVDREHRLLSGNDGRSDCRASRLGGRRMLPSLELSMDLLQMVGQCDNGYACVYQNNLSWSSPTTPLPAEAHPRIVFESLFGEGGSDGGPPRRAAQAGQPPRLDSRRCHAPAEHTGPERSRESRPVPRDRPRRRASHPEGRGGHRRTISCRISIGRSACRRRTPTTLG